MFSYTLYSCAGPWMLFIGTLLWLVGEEGQLWARWHSRPAH